VHSFANDLQYGLLTWSWGGDGAGQTTRSIWHQYAHRDAVGFARPDGLIELAEEPNRADDLESGFFAEANISTLPIWAHLDGDDDDGGDDDDSDPPANCGPLVKAILAEAKKLQAIVDSLAELARSCQETKPINRPEDGDREDDDDSGPLFGL
jgi:hypothetical protein